MWTSHATRANESCRTYGRFISHVRIRHVTRTNGARHKCEWVMPHIQTNHITFTNGSHHTQKRDMSHMRMSLVCMHVCACARAMCIYVYEWIHEFIYGRREQPDPSLHLLATIHLLVYPSTNHILQIHDFIWTDRSQSALNIRPAPGKSWFTVGPYEW